MDRRKKHIKPLAKSLSSIAIAGLMIASQPVFSAMSGPQKTSIDNLFDNYLNGNSATAAMVEVRERLNDGTFATLYRKSYGTLIDIHNSNPLPLNALMRQASVTKTVTAAVAQELINEGIVTPTTRIFCHAGQATIPQGDCIIVHKGILNDLKYYDIEFGHLMNHTSGLDQTSLRQSQIFDLLFTPSMDDIIREMRSTALLTAPGTTIDYSNLGYDLLAYSIGKASSGDFISYARNIATSIGVCESDLMLANPLFTSSVPEREPNYYDFNSWLSINYFERPNNNSIGMGDYVDGPDGGGTYGYIPGGGGTLMTTRAMLLFAENYNIYSGGSRPSSGTLYRAGGGTGTFSMLAQGELDRFDYAYTFNSNEEGSTQASFQADLRDEIRAITPTTTNQTQSAINNSSTYDTSCETLNTIEEPGHEIGEGAWDTFPISGASKVTVFGMTGNVNLHIVTPTPSIHCSSASTGVIQESCELDSDLTYTVAIQGIEDAKYMIDIEYTNQFEDGSFVANTNLFNSGSAVSVNTPNQLGAWVEIIAHAPSNDQYDLSLYYSNASSSRGMDIVINGNVVGQTIGATTGSWHNWEVETISNIDLNAGYNSIKFISRTIHGAPMMDRVDIRQQ